MEDIQERILQAAADGRRGGSTAEELKKRCGIESTEDLAAFEEALRNMENAYDLVETSDGRWQTAAAAGILKGKLSVNTKGMGFVDREDGDSVRIEEADQKDALYGDTVIVRVQEWQTYGQVVKVLERAHTKLIATYTAMKNVYGRDAGIELIADDVKLKSRKLKVVDAGDTKPIEGMRVQCRITHYGRRTLEVAVERTIGYKDDPGVDILSVLLDHDIEPEFPDEVREQVKTIPQEVSREEMQGRTDLRGEDTVTIDGDDSKDFDDAVAVKPTADGWILKVSIADVSHYVTEGSPLDKEAYTRGCSTYVTDRVVPMLPHELSNGICSLNPHVDRLANTCEMHISKNGETLDYRLYPSVINSTERMTYHNVNLILDGDSEMCERYKHLGTLFTDLEACADAIRARRVRQGAIDFESPEADIKVDEQGHPIDIRLRQRGHAERMIEDCMIAANCAVANQMKWAELPCVYRIHEEPEAKRLKNFTRVAAILGHRFVLGNSSVHPKQIQEYLNSVMDTPEYPVLSMLMLRCMQKAKYDPHCIGHFGLAEKEYLHFTSPIRRYPDLIVHRMLRKYVFEGCTDPDELTKDNAMMEDYAEQSSIRERASQDAEFDCDDMKKAEYMEKHVGETFDGVITGVTSFGFYVQLANTVEGMVRLASLDDDYYVYDEDRMELTGSRRRKVYRIGMQVKVRVDAANKGLGQVDFSLAGKKINNSRSHERRGSREKDRYSDRRRTGYRTKKYSHGRKN